ncbi:MAG: YbaB/EbfC family nucleoid-associated protein [Nitrospirae bacterium]|nr:YbaB/EbfC family nucleoid-associated protein [Nitrospirota bacterium]MBF0568620.1 YbaB/EbfC family nucleoid-associated protein [Nitrospirota bacterium]
MSKKMLGNLMKEAQKLQERMMKMQEEAAQKTAEASSGGGMVTAVANGSGQLISITIDKEVANPDDLEMLQDLVVAACNEAIKRAQEQVHEEMSKVTGGLQIPGMPDISNLFGK